jgi:hypothetical protein
MIHSNDKSLAQTIAAIEALDLELIKFKATRTEDGYGWSAQHADKMEVAYKRYLILHAKHPDVMLAPEQDIDRFWHMHILDTRKYAADCEATFGHFLHHFPYLGLRGEDDAKALEEAFAKMQALLAQEFGEVAAETSAAWCTIEPGKQAAAWCTIEPGKQTAAWCTIEPSKQTAAWCTIEPSKQAAAWCTIEPTTAVWKIKPVVASPQREARLAA